MTGPLRTGIEHAHSLCLNQFGCCLDSIHPHSLPYYQITAQVACLTHEYLCTSAIYLVNVIITTQEIKRIAVYFGYDARTQPGAIRIGCHR